MLTFLFIYVLGGITFLPLVVAAALAYTWYTAVPLPAVSQLHTAAPGEKAEGAPEEEASIPRQRDDLSTDLLERDALLGPEGMGGAKDMNADVPGVRVRSGWLIVRNTYAPLPPPSSYVSYVVSSYRSLTTRQPAKNSATGDPQAPRDRFFAVIKGTVLFLYEDEECGDIWAALDLGRYEVFVEGVEGESEEARRAIMDGEMYAKRYAIVLRRKAVGSAAPSEGAVTDSESAPERGGEKEKQREKDKADELAPPPRPEGIRRVSSASSASAREPPALYLPYFIFLRSNTQMEDWYLTLQTLCQPHSSPLLPLQPAVYSEQDMDALLQSIDALPEHIPTRWLNALLGRLFFAFYRTAVLEEFMISRMMRKLSKVKRPGFLKEVIVREVSLGSRPPTISKPMLKSLTRAGEASVEAAVSFSGEVRITLEALASLSLGSKFRSYTVKLVLAVVLRSLEGNLLIKIKEPPSNRIWYGFTAMPKMELEVVPVVSERQIKWSMILKPIEARLREIIQESIVLPNMDDIPFFDTRDLLARGGIFADSARKEKHIIGLASGPSVESSNRTEAEGLEPASLENEYAPVETTPMKSERTLNGASLLGRTETRASTASAPLLGVVGKEEKGHGKKGSWFGGGGKKGNVPSSWASGSASVVGVGMPGSASKPGAPEELAPGPGLASEQSAPLGRRSLSDPSAPKMRNEDLTLHRERSADSATNPMQGVVFPSTDALDMGPPSASSTSSRSSAVSISTSTPTQRLGPGLPRRPSRAISSGSYPSPEPWPSPTNSPVKGDSVLSGGSESSTSTQQQGTILASWRSRAADKQALQASVTQAKDAMKKWGVSFAAKRRAGGGVVGSMFGGRAGSQEDVNESEEEELEPERGRERQDQRNGEGGSRRKPVQYDDYSSSALDSEGEPAPSGRSSRASSVHSSQRTPSFSGGVSGGSHSRPASVRSFSSSGGGSGAAVKPAGFVLPSAPITTVELSTSPPPEDPPVPPPPRKSLENPPPPPMPRKSSDNASVAASRKSVEVPPANLPASRKSAEVPASVTTSRKSADVPVVVSPAPRSLSDSPAPAPAPAMLTTQPVAAMQRRDVQPSPIHVQPSAMGMTMTVPGIHASHKGELMALGSSPPVPPVPPRPELAKPIVQSVYKLFKREGSEAASESTASAPSVSASGTSPSSTSISAAIAAKTSPATSTASLPQAVPAPATVPTVPEPKTTAPEPKAARGPSPLPPTKPSPAPTPPPVPAPKLAQIPSPVPPPMPPRPVAPVAPALPARPTPPRPTPPTLPPRRPTMNNFVSAASTTSAPTAIPTLMTDPPSSPSRVEATALRPELSPDSPTASQALRHVASRHIARSSAGAASAGTSPSSITGMMEGISTAEPSKPTRDLSLPPSLPPRATAEHALPLSASPIPILTPLSTEDMLDPVIPEGSTASSHMQAEQNGAADSRREETIAA
ncbi:hypothetical protein CALCODRAFT_557334 [Calocera cornea HHB12733]|uniref:SMP-LTD domain-containing protein n=1 Tax=Calocera cornea HHB12733 TaxID=1353952 RepID=A0A165DXS6_9BASI|nr:hypothetical protein CALCODRAFT_557334 [Calocera cornea HHB12733]